MTRFLMDGASIIWCIFDMLFIHVKLFNYLGIGEEINLRTLIAGGVPTHLVLNL